VERARRQPMFLEGTMDSIIIIIIIIIIMLGIKMFSWGFVGGKGGGECVGGSVRDGLNFL